MPEIKQITKYSNLVFIMLLTLIINQCKAQSDKIDDQAENTIEVRAIITKKMAESKLKLGKVYNKCVKFLDSQGNSDPENYKSLLIESHNGWKTYSERKCKISEYQSRDAAQGGSAFYNLCKTELNEKRIAELKNLLSGWKLEFHN